MFNVSAQVHVSQQILVSLSMHITSRSEQQNSNYYLIMQYRYKVYAIKIYIISICLILEKGLSYIKYLPGEKEKIFEPYKFTLFCTM